MSDGSSDSQTAQAVDEAVQTVKDIIKEELGVEEEQLEEAMEVLGLSGIDLLNPQNLMDLAITLKDATDSGMLLFDPGFQNTLEGIQTVTQDLLDQLGMTMDELVSIVETQSLENLPEDFAPILAEENKDVPEIVEEKEPEAFAQQTVVQLEGQRQVVDDQPKDAGVLRDSTGRDAVVTQVAKPVQEETREVTAQSDKVTDSGKEQGILQTAQNVDSETEKDNGEEFLEGGNTKQNQPEQNFGTSNESFTAAAPAHQTSNEMPVVQNPQVNAPLPQTDIQNIMEQIVEYTRTNLTETVKTIEMQLNPEHLGKVFLHITEKAGTVTAQIATQNETMRDALMQQAVVLKENLNQQGVKVEAIEVSVGTHEFEDNLEKDAHQQEEQARQEEEASRRQGRRSLDLNNLDELSGLMTEEEELAARIMRDNGNNVDYKA